MARRVGEAFLHQAIDRGIGLGPEALAPLVNVEGDGDTVMMALPEGGEIGDCLGQADIGKARRPQTV